MKKLFLMVAIVGIVLGGYSVTNAGEANSQIDMQKEVGLTTNFVTLSEDSPGTWVLRFQYPTATTISVVIDGPGFVPGTPYLISAGTSMYVVTTGYNGILTIADILPNEDGTYQYVW